MAFIGGVTLACLVCEVVMLRTENNSFRDKLQSVKEEKQQLLNEKTKLESSFRDQLQLIKDKHQRLLNEVDQTNANHKVYSNQVKYIQRWMKPIGELEEHIQAVIHYSELKKKESEFYSYSDQERDKMEQLHRKIGYDFDKSYTNEIIIKAIDLIMEFKKECRKFLDALLSENIEKMKTLQDNTNMELITVKKKKFFEEVSSKYSDFNYQKSKEDFVQEDFVQTKSKEISVQRGDGIISTIIKEAASYVFSSVSWWAITKIVGFLLS